MKREFFPRDSTRPFQDGEKVIVKFRRRSANAFNSRKMRVDVVEFNIYLENDYDLSPGEYRLVPTGIYVDIPLGHKADIEIESGPLSKEGITLFKTRSSIDSGHKEEVLLILANTGKDIFHISWRMWLCNLRITTDPRLQFEGCEVFTESDEETEGPSESDEVI